MNPEALLAFAIPFALIAAGIGVLTKIAGTRWILGLFESEGEPSLRLVAMAAIVGFSLFMRSAGRITTAETRELLEMALGFSIIGTAKIIASRFSPKPTVDSTQQPKPDEPEQKA
jgi:hypothetical protein